MTLRRYESVDEIFRKIQDASTDSFNQIDTERSFGSVKEVRVDTNAKLGEYYFFEKPAADATLTLPPITKNDAGKIVSIKVGNSATKTITVRATGTGVTIDGSATESKTSGQFASYMVVNTSLWIRVS